MWSTKPFRSHWLSVAFSLLVCSEPAFGQLVCTPGWQGTVLIDGDSLTNWSVEQHQGAAGSLSLVPGVSGQAVELQWTHGPGDWVQAVYNFPPGGRDLSGPDIFGITLRGTTGERPNTVSIMFADTNGVFYGTNWSPTNSGINRNGINAIDRWMINIPVPKRQLVHFFGPSTPIDWTKIDRFFVVVKKPDPPTGGGGSGRLAIDNVRYDTAANWSRPAQFEVVSPDALVAARTIGFILSQQTATGLIVSYPEEASQSPPPKSWLYDLALALTALTREGRWENGIPVNAAAQAARRLVDFLLGVQKPDGHWARAWNSDTGAELVDDTWSGDRSWWIMALAGYAAKSGDAQAALSAQRGATWLATKIDSTGKVTESTEGNVDAWWALTATNRIADADRIKNYLLSAATVWDSSLRYWWRGLNDPVPAMDPATWTSFFARHPLVNQADKGLAALGFVSRTMATQSPDINPTACGFDGMGPVGLWNEGIAQYVSAGGPGAQNFLNMLVSQQKPDGSMPGSTEDRISESFGWLTRWRSLAATSWLYFAVTGPPFPGLVGNVSVQPPVSTSSPRAIAEVEQGAIRSGYMIITPDADSTAPVPIVTFGSVINGVAQSQAGIALAPMTTDAVAFVEVVPSIGRDVGVAIVNPGGTSNTLSLTLLDENGSTVASEAMVLNPRQHLARFVRDLFPARDFSSGFRGSLRILGSASFSALGLRFSGSLFSTLPLAAANATTGVPVRTFAGGTDSPLAGTVGGATSSILPQLAMSGGWATQVALLNNSASAIRGRVDVFDTSGNPMAVQWNGTTQSTFRYSVAAGGTVVLAPRDATGQSPF